MYTPLNVVCLVGVNVVVIEVEGVGGRQEKKLVQVVEHGMRYTSWKLALIIILPSILHM